MADSVVGAEETIPTLEEIQNMKVTDLRKKLKALGLPITGNKNDLTARLTEVYLSSKGMDSSLESSKLSFDSSEIGELEDTTDGTTPVEDGAEIEQEHFSYLEPSTEDESKLLTSPENKLNTSSNSSVIVTKPLKKRTIISSATESNPPKKVILNRTTSAHTEIIMNPVSTTKKETTVTNNKVADTEKKQISIKNLSAAERMAIRAKRFNTSNTTVTSTTIKATNTKDSKQSIISGPLNTDVEVLKKRAERFGQNVSTVLKQIEHKEKLLKRKCKFGASIAAVSSSNIDEQERKKLRATRFGLA